jgi:hypothetical protein
VWGGLSASARAPRPPRSLVLSFPPTRDKDKDANGKKKEERDYRSNRSTQNKIQSLLRELESGAPIFVVCKRRGHRLPNKFPPARAPVHAEKNSPCHRGHMCRKHHMWGTWRTCSVVLGVPPLFLMAIPRVNVKNRKLLHNDLRDLKIWAFVGLYPLWGRGAACVCP